MTNPIGYGDIKLFAGSASLELAQEIGAYLNVPLSGYDLVEFSNENLFIRLHGSVRGQDVYVIQSMDYSASPQHHGTAHHARLPQARLQLEGSRP